MCYEHPHFSLFLYNSHCYPLCSTSHPYIPLCVPDVILLSSLLSLTIILLYFHFKQLVSYLPRVKVCCPKKTFYLVTPLTTSFLTWLSDHFQSTSLCPQAQSYFFFASISFDLFAIFVIVDPLFLLETFLFSCCTEYSLLWFSSLSLSGCSFSDLPFSHFKL